MLPGLDLMDCLKMVNSGSYFKVLEYNRLMFVGPEFKA
ncbi:hypothetical protein LEP1GSC186_4762 [Leptospira noguchii serovar Autumnalis str. ZUN142]|uniref:Uncharacterized protein n=1 Tax=Leptospira noguchii serovar Autumnalis str. ZUN142 TaxID=1085540 RepID=M6UJ26_9LEPT|nr:hypothetical protein LEP1GSC186_4762 [Leptospira noguchii serovar Autumnalis str. ZUN142]